MLSKDSLMISKLLMEERRGATARVSVMIFDNQVSSRTNILCGEIDDVIG